MLRSFKSFMPAFFGVLFVLFGSVASNAAGLDLSSVTVDTSPVFTLAGIIVTAIASIWAIKKVIKLGNRS